MAFGIVQHPASGGEPHLGFPDMEPGAGRRPDVRSEGIAAILEHRHEGGSTMAMAMLTGAASADLFHLVGTGLRDDRFAVERRCRAQLR